MSKARRLVLMYRLRMAGVLEDLTLRQIGEMLGASRAAVLQDLRELDEAEREFRELVEAAPWTRWVSDDAKTPSAPDEEDIESLKRLVRDGLVWLEHWVTAEDGGG